MNFLPIRSPWEKKSIKNTLKKEVVKIQVSIYNILLIRIPQNNYNIQIIIQLMINVQSKTITSTVKEKKSSYLIPYQ